MRIPPSRSRQWTKRRINPAPEDHRPGVSRWVGTALARGRARLVTRLPKQALPRVDAWTTCVELARDELGFATMNRVAEPSVYGSRLNSNDGVDGQRSGRSSERPVVVISEDTMPCPFDILVLPASQRPHEGCKPDSAQGHRNRDQVEKIAHPGFRSKRSRQWKRSSTCEMHARHARCRDRARETRQSIRRSRSRGRTGRA